MSYPTPPTDAGLLWTKATRSANIADCVEVARTPDRVLARDSTNPNGPRLEFTRASWSAFLDAVKAGDFDRG